MFTRALKSVYPKLNRMQDTANEESNSDDPERRPDTDLVVRRGYVERERKGEVTVNVDGEEVDFSLDDVEGTFSLKKYDRIALYCEVDENSNRITAVRRFDHSKMINVKGKITSLESGLHGYVDNKYVFYWSALSDGLTDVHKDDRVEADCIECEVVEDGVSPWRCLKVTSINQPNDKGNGNVVNKETMNKNGIEITEDLKVEFNGIDMDETKTVTMTVKNTSTQDEFKVINNCFRGIKSESQLRQVTPTRRATFVLKPGDSKQYEFEAKAKHFGDACEQFVITFTGESAGTFKITRFIKVCVHDTERRHPTIGTGPNVHRNYQYTRDMSTRHQMDLISGEKPLTTPNFVAVRFDQWHVPKELQDILLNPASSRCSIFDALAKQHSHLNKPLTVDDYGRKFHDLLHLEEIEMDHSIRKYDVKSYFTREKEYLALAVQNVFESRPSIVIGDHIIATDPRSKEKDNMVGRRGDIHDVKQNHILLKFDESFHKNYKNEDYDITFHFSRRSLRKQHHAVELAMKRLPSILFPNEIRATDKQVDVSLNLSDGELQSGDSVLPWFNPSLNIVQKQAVANILQGVARPLPYIIFGPPGTGKTITLVESILQIVKNVPHSRILVATPSNSAANLITERIITSGVLTQKNQFLRLVGHNKVSRGMIPPTILGHCGTIDIARDDTELPGYKVDESTGFQKKCSPDRLKTYQMLIGTCVTLGGLMQCDFPEDHFTHVIIDESGQNLETELIIPLSFVDKDVGQVILAGDPMQLGPIVISHFAKTLGLAQSFLCRLLDRSLYQPDSEKFEHRYDPRLVTKLVNNYRSLPSIMRVYNDLFYNGDLKAMVNEVDSVELQLLTKLNRIIPTSKDRIAADGVIFVGVEGRNERCSDSPSWYNAEEADKVIAFYTKLMRLGHDSDDIGIITPYTQQVKTIRTKLKEFKMPEPKIGTVEEFQGQERKIILLSTVRTVDDHLADDKRYSLGFIKHPNRMNVAISRARALLVVFGSPKLLSRDKNWKSLIEHCKKTNSYAVTPTVTIED